MHKNLSLVQLIWILVVIFLSTPGFAMEFGSTSPEVRAVQQAFHQEGRVFPVTTYPVSRTRLEQLAQEIGIESPTPPIHTATWYAGTWFDANIATKTLLIEPNAPRVGMDIRRSWVQRAPFLRLGIGFESDHGLMAALEMEGKKVWDDLWTNNNNWPRDGGPGFGIRFESQLLARSVLAYEIGGLRISLGRNSIHLGPPGVYGFYPTALLPYLDSARIQANFGRWELFFMMGSFHPVRSWEGIDVGANGLTNDWAWNELNPTPTFFGVHRLQYTGERFRFAIADQLFMARPNAPLEFNDFFPLGAYHGTDFFPDNLSMMIDLSWTIFPSFTVHAMAAFDDINSDIFGVADSPVPTIDAYLLALEYNGSVQGFDIHGLLQGGYTHYLFGNFEARETAGGGFPYDMPLSRYIARYYMEGAKGFLLPFNTPHGPGSLWLDLDAKVTFPNFPLTLGLDFLLLSRNTQANLITTPFEGSDAVRNAPRRVWSELGVSATTKIPTPIGRFEASLRPTLVVAEGEAAFGVNVLLGMEFGGTSGSIRSGR